MSKLVAVIAGVGPGTGGAVARKFASLYPVVLLARNPDNYDSLVKDINGAGGKAIGISTDIADAKSVKAAFDKIGSEFGGDYGLAVRPLQLTCIRLCADLVGHRPPSSTPADASCASRFSS